MAELRLRSALHLKELRMRIRHLRLALWLPSLLLGCASCHGDSATDGTFKMPNPKLPKLPTKPEGFKQLMVEKPQVMEFMAKQVKPTMATLLGEPEWTPATKKGFGCVECHTQQQ